MPNQKTSEKILTIANELLAHDGVSGVSFDAIARRLGRSKQAVLYWYPTKQDLLGALFLPWLQAETDAAVAALTGPRGRDPAITSFVRAIAEFHLADLDRFRMMYLVPQTTRSRASDFAERRFLESVHPVTDQLYAALAHHLDPDQPERARAEAMAIHSATLGLVLMNSLAAAVNDPLKHGPERLIQALVTTLTDTARPPD